MKWYWPPDAAADSRSPYPGVTLEPDKVVWHLDADDDFKIPGQHDEQSIEDFVQYGPAWPAAPADIVDKLLAQLQLTDPVWRRPGFQPYSPAWLAIDRRDEAAALEQIHHEDVNRIFRHRMTLLLHAAGRGMERVIDALLLAGADVGARNDKGQNALVCAALGESAAPAIAMRLVEAGCTMLDEACAIAIQRNRREIVTALIDNGAAPLRVHPFLITDAAQRGWTAVVQELLRQGGDPNQRTINGWTPLICASDPATVRLLLDHGANPNLEDNNKETALVSACCHGQIERLELLLAAGADPNARVYRWGFGSRGDSILTGLRRSNQFPQIQAILRRHGAR